MTVILKSLNFFYFFTLFFFSLSDIEEENEGIRRELAESKNATSGKFHNQIEELQAKVIELESELDARNNELLDLLQLCGFLICNFYYAENSNGT